MSITTEDVDVTGAGDGGQVAVDEGAAAEQVVGRVFMEAVGAFHLLTTYVGHTLGLWPALAGRPGSTAEDLARELDLDRWYVTEWLQAETIAGLVQADRPDLHEARFTLAPGVAAALVDETGPAYIGGLPYTLPAVGRVLPELLAAYRSGEGVAYAAYGPEAIRAQGALNRPAFVNDLTQSWIPEIPGVFDRLRDQSRPARIADIGCGIGWAAIELAKAFPHVHIDGFDVDEDSISAARRNAADQGVAGRITFEVRDASAGELGEGVYDLVLMLECLHDLGRPVEALETARRAVAPGGTVVVMDERVAESLPPAGDPVETFFAAASVLWCLPQSRVVPDCEAPGTVMRPATLEAFARRAGWQGVDILPIEHPFWRFYRLAG